jgi:hypothetical protein
MKYTVRNIADGYVFTKTDSITDARSAAKTARQFGFTVEIRRESDGMKMCDMCRGCYKCNAEDADLEDAKGLKK